MLALAPGHRGGRGFLDIASSPQVASQAAQLRHWVLLGEGPAPEGERWVAGEGGQGLCCVLDCNGCGSGPVVCAGGWRGGKLRARYISGVQCWSAALGNRSAVGASWSACIVSLASQTLHQH